MNKLDQLALLQTMIQEAIARNDGSEHELIKQRRELWNEGYRLPRNPAKDIEAAKEHHRVHGDMDGTVCLLPACALHYPAPKGKDR